MTVALPIVGEAYTDRSSRWAAATCVNLFPVKGGPETKTVTALRGVPGLVEWVASLKAAGVRGMAVFAGMLFVVVGDEVHQVTTAGASSLAATLNTSTGPVAMASNGQVLAIVDGTDGWLSGGGTPFAKNRAYTTSETVRPTTATGYLYACTTAGYTGPTEPTWSTILAGTTTAFTPDDWQASTHYELGEFVKPTTPNGYIYMAVSGSGTTGGSEPTWPTTVGLTVVDNGITWICQLAAVFTTTALSFTRISDADFPTATQIEFLGNRFVLDDPSQAGRFMVSGLLATDPTDFIDALDYATAEADPDKLVAIRVVAGHLWALGENTTEVWAPSNDVFPLSRSGYAFDRGCEAAWSAAKAGDALLWLSRDRLGRLEVVMGAGYQVQRVSTEAIEFALQGYATTSDATAWCYSQEGHTFYVLNFPAEDVTWVYDLTTDLWHRRGGYSAGWTRHEGDCAVEFAGRRLVGGTDGALYELDPDVYKFAGTAIRRERAAPTVGAYGQRIFHHALTLDVEAGVGNADAANPTLSLDWSDDYGATWATARSLALGASGAPTTRVVARRLGASRDRIYRVTITDPVKVTLLGAALEAEAGTA